MEEFGLNWWEEFRDLIQDADAIKEIFGDRQFVNKPAIMSVGVEKGSAKHRTHFNLVVSFKHSIPLYSVKKLNQRFKQWLDQELGHFITGGWALFGKLVGGYAHNYAIKDTRWEANLRFLEDHGNDPEVIRLSSVNEDGSRATLEPVNFYGRNAAGTVTAIKFYRRLGNADGAAFRDREGNPSNIRLYNHTMRLLRVNVEAEDEVDLPA